MWIDGLKSLRGQLTTLEGRLLAGRVPFGGSTAGAADDALASADAVLALLARKATAQCELALVQPEATPIKARQTLLALAFAELEHYMRSPYQSGPAGLLFVTQQIVDARAHFSGVRVGAASFATAFNILSPPASPARHWKNLLIANPGRALKGGPTLRGLRALVIDASHPRTLQHVPALLSHPDLVQIPLRIIVGPLHESLLGGGTGRMNWLWDPSAMAQVHALLTPGAIPAPGWARRKYWLAGNAAIDAKFAEAEGLLSEATRLGGTAALPEIIEAWGVLSAAKGLTVPLEQAERAWHNSPRGERLKDRIELLRRATPAANGELRHFLAMHWAGICQALGEAYDLLAAAGVSPKFFTLIDALDQFSERRDLPLRVITPTDAEAPLLASRLAEIDADLAGAIDAGIVEILPQREESKRVAEGLIRTTVLTGARSSRYRHLDLFTSREVHVVAYPSEGVRDRQRLERAYGRWLPIADGQRARVALQLKLTPALDTTRNPWRPPTIELYSSETAAPVTRAMELPQASLDVAWAALDDTPTESVASANPAGVTFPRGNFTIVDTDDGRISIPVRRFVDVYRPHTEKLVRLPIHEVAAGDFLVVLLDDECDTIFQRMCEIGNRRRPALNTVNLERWNVAKSRIYHRYDGMTQRIYHILEDRLSVSYQALTGWFGSDREDEGERLAPLNENDFKLIATLSGIYRDEEDMHTTFRSIHEERVNRRKLGRQLRSALKSLARGQQFEHALRTSEALNSDAEEVMHAIELREVARLLPPS